MEEKKLTDETVNATVKSLKWVCNQIPNDLGDSNEEKMLKCIQLYCEQGIAVIERLQSENADLKKLVKSLEELKATLLEERKVQKAEIERLTEEKGKYQEKWQTSYMNELNLQKQVDELKEQLKSVQSSCQSKNGKIKTLNSEKEALQNELNFQNGKPHYRYVIWNTKQNKRQFLSICEMTESGAYTKLFQKIGWDSAKYRFEVRRIKVDGVEVE